MIEFLAAGFNGIFFNISSFSPIDYYLNAINNTHRDGGYVMVNLTSAGVKVPLWFYSEATDINTTVFYDGSYSSWLNYLQDGNTSLVNARIGQYTNLTVYITGASPSLSTINLVNIFHVMKLRYFSLLPLPSVSFFHFIHVGTFTRAGRKFGQYWDVAWFERPLNIQ